MAKKTRAPAPPRPVQAPRTRLDRARRNRWPLIVIAAALRSAGSTARTLPDQGAGHMQRPDEKVKYNSFPPTSGRHSPEPAIFNMYEQPIDQKMGVHNLEHGGVLIQYGKDVPQSEVEKLREFWRGDPTGVILAPLPRLDGRIALTAWTHLALCRQFDEGAFDAFLDAYRFKGPERLPPDALQPGM